MVRSGRICARVAPAVAVLLVSAAAAPAGLITLNLTPSIGQVPVNGTFDVIVSANIEQSILGFGFDLVFDDSALEIKSVEIGSSFLPLPAPDGDKLAGLAFPNEVVGSNVTLATATFAAKMPGIAAIRLDVTPGDYTEGFPESGGLRYSQFTIPQTQVKILAASNGGGDTGGGTGGGDTGDGTGGGGPPPDVPEPASMLILAFGGLALAARRRR